MLKKIKYYIKNRKLKNRENTFGPFAKGVIYETANGLIAMSHQDMMIGKHLGFKGSWNLPEIESLKQLINKTDNIYVVGTHVGTLLIPLAKQCKTVVGYEANPNTFWFLKQNILLNDVKNTQIFNLAVGDEKRNITFYKSKINTGGSKIKPVHDNIKYNFDNPEEVEIPMISLDQHIIENKLPAPDCVLMDIEGAEYLALQGMQETLKNIRFLYMEYVPHHLKDVSGISNKDLMKLIVPFFDKTISTNKKIEIDISGSTDKLIEFLDDLNSSNTSDDLIFIKTSIPG